MNKTIATRKADNATLKADNAILNDTMTSLRSELAARTNQMQALQAQVDNLVNGQVRDCLFLPPAAIVLCISLCVMAIPHFHYSLFISSHYQTLTQLRTVPVKEYSVADVKRVCAFLHINHDTDLIDELKVDGKTLDGEAQCHRYWHPC
jgi:hypothetical protein